MTCVCRLLPLSFFLAALAAAAQPEPDWVKVAPADKAFSVLFPDTPEKQTDKIDTPTGPIEVIAYALKPEKDRPAYLLSYSEFPAHHNKLTAEQRLDKARASALASTKGKLQSEKKLTLQGNPGRELLIVGKDKEHLRTQIYVVGNRVYQLFVVGPADQVGAKDAVKFFDSFKVKAP
jgi:hypothetical protein